MHETTCCSMVRGTSFRENHTDKTPRLTKTRRQTRETTTRMFVHNQAAVGADLCDFACCLKKFKLIYESVPTLVSFSCYQMRFLPACTQIFRISFNSTYTVHPQDTSPVLKRGGEYTPVRARGGSLETLPHPSSF